MSPIKRKHKPKLIKRDKYLYAGAFTLSAFLGLCLLFPILVIRRSIAFHEPLTIATTLLDIPIVFVLPPQICALAIFFLIEHRFEKRLPFFSKLKIKRGVIIAATILIVISVTIIPLSLFGRTTVTANGEIAHYNLIGQKDQLYQPEDVSAVALEIEVHRSYSRRAHGPTYTIDVTFDISGGKEFSFNRDAAFNGNLEEKLTHLMNIKNIYADILTIKGTDLVHDFIKYENLNETEAQSLQQLFEIQ